MKPPNFLIENDKNNNYFLGIAIKRNQKKFTDSLIDSMLKKQGTIFSIAPVTPPTPGW